MKLIMYTKVNDGEFRRAQKDFASFIGELTTLVVEKDATIPELPSKDIVSSRGRARDIPYMNHHTDEKRTQIFRIYRDVRFSKVKTPYKVSSALPPFCSSLLEYLLIYPAATLLGSMVTNHHPNQALPN